MPELPEVETIKRILEKYLVNTTIINIEVNFPDLLKNIFQEEFIENIKGKKILKLERKGKYILIKLESGIIIMHLRMTGRLIIKSANDYRNFTSRVIFILSNKVELLYCDSRALGTIYYFDKMENINLKGLLNLGPEPLSQKFTVEYLFNLLKGTKASIKAVLLKQENIAGLGNIYVNESLFHAKIAPNRKANTIIEKECLILYTCVNEVINNAIMNCGTSFRDYVDAQGNKGHNQEILKVYGRKNKKCFSCGSLIKYNKLAGRGTYWCILCQR